MTLSLNMRPTPNGIVMTFESGQSAGIILVDTSSETGPLYQFSPPVLDLLNPAEYSCPGRCSREAAQYDALAWAADQE